MSQLRVTVTRQRPSGETGRRRWSEIRRRCRRLGVEAERVVLRDATAPPDVARILDAVIRRPEPVSALVCATHGLAPLLLRGLSAARLELPRDCSFVTYGDSEWAAAYRPAISTVTMDLYAVAAVMTRRIIAGLSGSAESSGEIPQPSQFLRRESTGPFPGRLS